MPYPQGNPLKAIWGASSSDVWAIGDKGTSMHWDGANWTLFPMEAGPSSAHRVWGRSSTDAWAAGIGLQRWNGAAWSTIASGPFTAMGAIVTPAVADYDVLAYHPTSATAGTIAWWHGSTSGTVTTVPQPAANFIPVAFFGTSAEPFAMAADSRLAKWTGSSWGVTPLGSTHNFVAAAVIDATHVVAVEPNSVQFWDGVSYTTRPGLPTGNYDTVAARSFTDVWACAAGTCYHWDGAAWSSLAATPTALWIDPSGALWTAEASSRVRVWNGSAWADKTVGTNTAQYVGGTADTDLWAISPGGADGALHWDGVTWTSVPFPYGGYLIGDIWALASNNVYVAAGVRLANGIALHMLRWDGSTWTDSGSLGTIGDAISAPFMEFGFQSVWGSDASNVYAATGANSLWHNDGTGWSTIPNKGGNDVFGRTAGDVYVVGSGGLHHYDGADWTDIAPPGASNTGSINSATDIWLGGATNAYHFDGTFFVTLNKTGRPVGSATHMFLLDAETFHEWPTGFSGSTTSYPSLMGGVRSGWVSPSGRTYAAGAGLITHP